MAGTRLRAGIVGLSWIAADKARPASAAELGSATPYSHASAMFALGNVDVVAVCDRRPEAIDSFQAQWGDAWPSMRAYEDANAMLEAEDLDLVSIVTPDHMHASMVGAAVDAGVPMIFCEKPLATDLPEADALVRRVLKSTSTVAVNHTKRWRPDLVEARGILAAGDLGPIAQIVIESGGPRAMLFRNHSHALDLAVFLADDVPSWVIGELEPGHEEYGTQYRGDGGSDAALEPGANAYIGFERGARAFLAGFKASSLDLAVHVLCESGKIRSDLLGTWRIDIGRDRGKTPDSVSVPSVQPVRPRATREGMTAGLADLIDAHAEGRLPSSSVVSARHTVALFDAILRSQAEGGRRVPITPLEL